MSYIIVKQESPVLIIGQAPAQRDDPSSPLSGRSGQRLADLMGISLEEFLETFDRANLFNKWLGKQGKGDKFPRREAARNAHWLIANNRLHEYKAIVVLGKEVARALGYRTDEWFTWRRYHDCSPNGEGASWVCVIPHPSGIVRWWNEKRNQKIAKEFLTEMYDRLLDGTHTRI